MQALATLYALHPVAFTVIIFHLAIAAYLLARTARLLYRAYCYVQRQRRINSPKRNPFERIHRERMLRALTTEYPDLTRRAYRTN